MAWRKSGVRWLYGLAGGASLVAAFASPHVLDSCTALRQAHQQAYYESTGSTAYPYLHCTDLLSLALTLVGLVAAAVFLLLAMVPGGRGQ